MQKKGGPQLNSELAVDISNLSNITPHFQNISGGGEEVPVLLQSVEADLLKLRTLLARTPTPAPFETAHALGSLLKSTLETADSLGLDPQGCLVLAGC